MSTEHYTSGALALLLSPEVKFVNSFWKTVNILICTRQPSLSEEQICYQSLSRYQKWGGLWTVSLTHCGLG